MSRPVNPSSPGPADVLERALAALPQAPPPPPVERVFAPGAESHWYAARQMSRIVVTLTVAASILVVLGGTTLFFLMSMDRGSAGPSTFEPAVETGLVRITAEASADVRAFQEGRPVELVNARTGALIDSRTGAALRLDDRVSVTLDPSTRMVLGEPGAVEVVSGRAAFDVAHGGAAPFRVLAGGVTVTDLGTRFTVDRTAQAARDRVLVTVEEGRVEANGIAMQAGEGLAFQEGTPVGGAWHVDAKPSVTLEVEDPSPRAQAPVVLRVVLRNSTDGWVGWPTTSSARSPLMVNVVDRDGVPSAIRVTDAMVLTEIPFGRAIPPRGSLVLRVRFERTFASPGTYRLRAVYRPSGEVESPTSPEVVMEVR